MLVASSPKHNRAQSSLRALTLGPTVLHTSLPRSRISGQQAWGLATEGVDERAHARPSCSCPARSTRHLRTRGTLAILCPALRAQEGSWWRTVRLGVVVAQALVGVGGGDERDEDEQPAVDRHIRLVADVDAGVKETWVSGRPSAGLPTRKKGTPREHECKNRVVRGLVR